MKKRSNDDSDDRLVDFLRQHRPTPPPANPELETRILLTTQVTMRRANSYHQNLSPHRYLWALPSAIAASLLIGWTGYQFFLPSQPPVDTANVEAFLKNNWNNVSDNTTEPDWFLTADLSN